MSFLKHKGDVIFTSYDIAEILGCTDKMSVITKCFTKNNSIPLRQGTQYGNGNGSYYWATKTLTEKVFQSLNEAKLIPDILSYEDLIKILQFKIWQFTEKKLTKKEIADRLINPVILSDEQKYEHERLVTLMGKIKIEQANLQLEEERKREAIRKEKEAKKNGCNS